MIQGQVNNLQLPTSLNFDGSDPDSSAILDVQSQNKGVLFPRMDFTQISQIANPEEGLMVYDTEFNCLRIYSNDKWDCLYVKPTNSKKGNGDLTGWNVPYDGEADPIDIEINSKDQVVVLADFDESYQEYLGVYDKSGNLIWDQTSMGFLASSMRLDANDNIYLRKYLGLVKLDETGNQIWTKQLPMQSSEYYYANGWEIDDSGNIYFGGVFKGDISIGQFSYTSGNNTENCFVAKFDNDLNLIWFKPFGGSTDNRLVDICIDSQGNVFAIGDYTIDFTIDDETTLSQSTYNYFIVRLLSTGSLDWSHSIQTNSNFLIEDCKNIGPKGVALMATGSNDFTYTAPFLNIYQVSDNNLLAFSIDNSGYLYYRGLTELTSNVYSPQLAVSAIGDFYVQMIMNDYQGDFGSISVDDYPSETYLVKYNYNSGVDKSFEWLLPLPMHYKDFDFMNNETLYLLGTLRGQTILGNTVLSMSHNDHNIVIAKYIE